MNNTESMGKPGLCNSAIYQITVQGILDPDWSVTFNHLEIIADEIAQVTILKGLVRDQSELLGILQQLNGLPVPILSIECVAAHDG